MGTESLWGASPVADKRAKPTHCQVFKFAEQVLEFPWQLLQVEGRRCQMSGAPWVSWALLTNPQVLEGERAGVPGRGLGSLEGGKGDPALG